MGFELRPENSKLDTGSAVMWAHHEVPEASSQRFYAMSTVVHIAMLLATALISAPLIEKAEVETVTIEIESEATPIAKGAAVAATRGGSPSNIPVAEMPTAPVKGGNELAGNDDIVVTKPAGKIKSAKAAVPASAKSSKLSSMAPKAAPVVAVAASIDDIDAPELDEALIEKNQVVRGIDDDFGNDFNKVDHQQKAKVKAIASQLNSAADEAAQEGDEFLNSLADETNKNTQAFLAANKARRAKDYEGIASALAAEKAAARAAAAAAAARAQAARNGTGQGQGAGGGQTNGMGAGNNGANAPSTMLAGTPNGIRKLEQLRQMPGNPIPQYSTDERLNGHQGNIVFYAYVDKNGFLNKFKQVSTTGYANLDSKTLTALKKWRFYPGQEGWVELPFGWTLKGGAKAIGGTLRTRSAMR